MPQITTILRNFGHPMQILPFGQEVGHFKDITALVATKNLNRIPHAYTYREGDYATKIDILILSTRIWEESYFPPPGDDSFPLFTQTPSPSQNRAGPSNPQPRSPSSSASNGVPSEPTIDLFAWSPRSRNITSPTSQFWVSHPIRTYHLFLGNRQATMLTNPTRKAPFSSSDSRCHKDLHTHGSRHTLATKNPNLLKIPLQLSSILYASLTAVPNPIAINPLRSLRTVNSNILSLGEAQKSLILDSHCLLTLSRYREGASEATGMLLEASYLDLILSSENEAVSKELLKTNPAQNDLLAGPLSLTPLLGSFNPAQKRLPLFSGHTQDQNLNHLNQTEAYSENMPALLRIQQQQQLPTYSPTSAPPKSQQNKQRAVPTRRSQRILEKRSTFDFEQNAKKKKTKTQISMLSFDKDSHHSLLDASKTLQILQATGLKIDKQIEDLIEEAVKQDQDRGNTEQPTPTTPLHDPIPPFFIPGTNMLL